MTERIWTYYLDTSPSPALFRKYVFLAEQWDSGNRRWVEIDHMYLPNRLRQGDVYLDDISEDRAKAIIAGTDAAIAR